MAGQMLLHQKKTFRTPFVFYRECLPLENNTQVQPQNHEQQFESVVQNYRRGSCLYEHLVQRLQENRHLDLDYGFLLDLYIWI